MRIWHGKRDATVPWQMSQDFYRSLVFRVGHDSSVTGRNTNLIQDVECCWYDEWTHTSPILELPLSGSHDFHRQVVMTVRNWTSSNNSDVQTLADDDHALVPLWVEDDPILQPLLPCCPSAWAKLAQFFMPF